MIGRWLVIGVVVCGAGALAPAQQRQQTPDRTSVLILGAGSPQISADRSGTCIGVVAHGTVYLFDAGPGVEHRMFEARARSNAIQHIGPLFITHLHSDHTLGIPAVLYYVREEGKPFTIYGPPGLNNMMTHILAAWQEDKDMRMKGGEGAPAVWWETHVHEVTSGVVFKDDNVTVRTFEVPHGKWEHALGYRIDASDRSIVISGDTRPSDAIVQACNGCDVLVHEVAWENPSRPSRSQYMTEFHTTPAEVGELATRAKAKMVVLYHQVIPAGRGPAQAIDFVRAVMTRYQGPIMYARDLDMF